MDETEIEFLKAEIKRGANVVWRSCDGDVYAIAGIVDSYKESWEEIAGPVAVFVRGGHADLMNVTLDEFHFMMPVTDYY